MNYNNSVSQQIQQCEQIMQQLIQQTQQASSMYQQMLQQEQQNAARLEELAQRERQAAHMIQTALQGHQTAVQQYHQVTQLCKQLESSIQASAQMVQPQFGRVQGTAQTSSFGTSSIESFGHNPVSFSAIGSHNPQNRTGFSNH
ncbi:AMP-dependent synthetase and ligase [Paenibacillus sp. JX-17]|uniref:AMP-dependent synthetase and ligase n=1 Tax=Paenibacillus lacisoli TaxID=3064525 RepID=A0ABT9CG84_9BACL|nr:AMP-dependent synthetase and ligase [Paenibacillus sp. JX-17]MDO7908282.1 AMP-dependent synthetase and ligase [Paenibacillus sp. JX-17]